MTERLDRIETLLLGLAERQSAYDERLTRVEGILESTARAQAASTDQMGQCDERLTRVETILENTVRAQAANTDQIGRNAEANTANAEAVEQNEQRFSTLLEDSRADRAENRRRFDAAQQVIQALLMQVANLNGRVEDLEGAA